MYQHFLIQRRPMWRRHSKPSSQVGWRRLVTRSYSWRRADPPPPLPRCRAMWPRYSAQHWTGSTRLYLRRVSWPAQEVSEGVIPLQLPYRRSVRVSYHCRSSGCCHTGVQGGCYAHYRSPVRVACLFTGVQWGCHAYLQQSSEGVMPITGVQWGCHAYYRSPVRVSCPLQEFSEGVMPACP